MMLCCIGPGRAGVLQWQYVYHRHPMFVGSLICILHQVVTSLSVTATCLKIPNLVTIRSTMMLTYFCANERKESGV